MSDPLQRLSAALADRYAIEQEIGAGGMATVYLARDVKHDRKVAVKVLRPELAAVLGAERFVREIRTIAVLQHPHILGLIDSGEVDGTAYYVMPYVDGESLRDRLNREKQLPVADAVRIATEVAGALDYAHRHGVIHRDVKPENVMLHDDSAMVTDFGIALAAQSAGGTRMTETGMSLGTPHYMSPEQAMGDREITARSDVYSLGVTTYEMLTGDPPFTGSTAQAIVAQVLTEDPRPLTQQRRTTPAHVEAAVLTALEKVPADRFGSAAEFAKALHEGIPAAAAGGRKRSPTAVPPYRLTAISPYRLTALVAAIILALVGAFWLGGKVWGASTSPLSFGTATKVTWEPDLELLPAVSPDGRSVAYGSGPLSNMQIHVRPIAGGRSIALTNDTTGIQSHPRWSPDGTRVLFLTGGGVSSAPSTGGPARAEVPPGRDQPVGSAAYSPDGQTVAYVIGDSLFLRGEDGVSRPLASFFQPSVCMWSPDGGMIACTSGNVLGLTVGPAFGNRSPSRIVVCRVADGQIISVTDSLTVNQSPVWSPDSRWLYFVSERHGPRDLYAQRLSRSGQPSGEAVRLTTGLGVHTFSLSADGSVLSYSILTSASNVWSLARTDPQPASGNTATKVTSGNQTVGDVAVSSDGTWLLYSSDLSGNMDVYRMRLPNGAPERLTTDPADDFAPSLSPDGREVVFHSWRGGSRDIFVMPLDGGPIQRVTSSPRHEAYASWSPDGQTLAFNEFTGSGAIWTVPRTNGEWGTPVKRLDYGFWPSFSPDGRHLVFSTSLVDGSLGVIPVDSGPARIVLDSVSGVTANQAFWLGGNELLFRGHDALNTNAVYAVPVTGGRPRLVAQPGDQNRPMLSAWWSYHQGRIYYSVAERQSDVWAIEVQVP